MMRLAIAPLMMLLIAPGVARAQDATEPAEPARSLLVLHKTMVPAS